MEIKDNVIKVDFSPAAKRARIPRSKSYDDMPLYDIMAEADRFAALRDIGPVTPELAAWGIALYEAMGAKATTPELKLHCQHHVNYLHYLLHGDSTPA